MDPAAIEALVADIEAGRYGLIDDFLLIRNGRVIADRHWDHGERYAELLPEQDDTVNHQYNYDHPAWHPYYRETGLHTLQSVTKTCFRWPSASPWTPGTYPASRRRPGRTSRPTA